MNKKFDLIFLGGGLASVMTSRFIKLRNPHLKVAVINQTAEARWSPGESTVEFATLFLLRDLKLGSYLYQNHLPKNGLRFLFQSEENKENLNRYSEIGTHILPALPSFQIDRKRIVEDLWKLNAELGIEHFLNTEVTHIEFDQPEHSVDITRDNQRSKLQTNWLINAGGKGGFLSDFWAEKSPLQSNIEHHINASWGRFNDVPNIDFEGDEEWQKRSGYNPKYLSTTHFMGKGYWLWLIPIGNEIVSVGVVYDQREIQLNLQDQEQFLAFVNQKLPFEGKLSENNQLDFQRGQQLAHKRAQFCSPERWALLGNAYMFSDPFYSPGSDVIARQAYLLNHLVNCSDADLVNRSAIFNEFFDIDFETLIALYQDQYLTFDSFELFDIKYLWDFHTYLNRIVFPFYAGSYDSLEWIEGQLVNRDRTLNIIKAIQNGFLAAHNWLNEKGLTKRFNAGRFSYRQNRFPMQTEFFFKYSESESLNSYLYLCRLTIAELIHLRFGIEDFLKREQLQEAISLKKVEEFVLSEAWLKSIVQRASRRFNKLLKPLVGTEKGAQVSLYLDMDSAKIEFQINSSNKNEKLYSEIESLWNEQPNNPVQNSLLHQRNELCKQN